MELEILKELIKISELSQKEFSIKTNTPAPRISEWLNEVYTPKLSKLILIAEKIGYEIKFKIEKIEK